MTEIIIQYVNVSVDNQQLETIKAIHLNNTFEEYESVYG